jgi:hypothetical protein
MIDAIPPMAWCSLPDGSVELLNQRWHDYTGLSPRFVTQTFLQEHLYVQISQIKVFPQEIHHDRTSGTAERSAPGGMIDSYEAAELLQVFLMGRRYWVSANAALDAAGRVEMAAFSPS